MTCCSRCAAALDVTGSHLDAAATAAWAQLLANPTPPARVTRPDGTVVELCDLTERERAAVLAAARVEVVAELAESVAASVAEPELIVTARALALGETEPVASGWLLRRLAEHARIAADEVRSAAWSGS